MQKILEETKADRDCGLLCGVRLTLTTASRSLAQDELRESLMLELQSAKELLWLEKVRVRRRRARR